MLVAGIRNGKFYFLDGEYTNQGFSLNKVYEGQKDHLESDYSNPETAQYINNEISKLIPKEEMATKGVAIFLSNRWIRKYVFSSDAENSSLSLQKLLANELDIGLDIYFHPEEKNYYLLQKVGVFGKLQNNLILEVDKSVIQNMQNISTEFQLKELQIVPEWIGFYNFISEFSENVKNVLIFEILEDGILEVTAIKNGQLLSVFDMKTVQKEIVYPFLSEFIQSNFLENPPLFLNLTNSNDLDWLTGLNLETVQLDIFSHKLISKSSLNLHQMKSFFSLIGMLK